FSSSSSYQKPPVERRFCELERLRIQLAADAQRHVQRRDEAEAAPALVVPLVIVGIEWETVAHFLDAAREFLARDDAVSADAARAHLFADHDAPPRTEGESSPIFSPVFGGVLRFLVPFRSLIAKEGPVADPLETPIPSAFPSVSDGARK